MMDDEQAEREDRRERIARIVGTNCDLAVDWILILQDDIAELKQELAKAKPTKEVTDG